MLVSGTVRTKILWFAIMLNFIFTRIFSGGFFDKKNQIELYHRLMHFGYYPSPTSIALTGSVWKMIVLSGFWCYFSLHWVQSSPKTSLSTIFDPLPCLDVPLEFRING